MCTVRNKEPTRNQSFEFEGLGLTTCHFKHHVQMRNNFRVTQQGPYEHTMAYSSMSQTIRNAAKENQSENRHPNEDKLPVHGNDGMYLVPLKGGGEPVHESRSQCFLELSVSVTSGKIRDSAAADATEEIIITLQPKLLNLGIFGNKIKIRQDFKTITKDMIGICKEYQFLTSRFLWTTNPWN